MWHKLAVILVAIAVLGLSSAAGAEELSVLSAGAVEPGLVAAIADFQQATVHSAKVTFNTAPQLRQRLESGERWDVVIAPPTVLEEFAKAGKLRNDRVSVGRVGLGVAVRADAPIPSIGDVDALKQSILAADSIVFNRASTGIYFEGLLKKLGLLDAVQQRITRYDNGAAVMDHLQQGTGREIGFGAITEILLYRDRGMRYVGPLPAPVQNYTAYAAASSAASAPPAQLLVHYLGSPRGRTFFTAVGIE